MGRADSRPRSGTSRRTTPKPTPPGGRRIRVRDVLIVVLLIAGLLSGLVLVVVSGGATPPTTAPEVLATIPSDLSRDSVEAWSGLVLPASAADFLTASVGSQLDVTFTMSPDDVDAFVSESALPAPEPERRVVLHSSPLWKLNPTTQTGETEGEDAAPAEGAAPGDAEGEDESPEAEGDDASPDAEGAEADMAMPSSDIWGVADVRGAVGRSVELVPEGDLVRARVVLLALG